MATDSDEWTDTDSSFSAENEEVGANDDNHVDDDFFKRFVVIGYDRQGRKIEESARVEE